MIIEPDRGGQVQLSADDYIEGGPELAAEIVASTASIDTTRKLQVYRRNGVKEYIIWRVLDRAIDWYLLQGSAFQALTPDANGVLKSQTFPGLWLSVPHMIQLDLAAVLQLLQQGIASPEHEDFVRRLAAS